MKAIAAWRAAVLGAAAGLGCITINVHFPAHQVEEAAGVIVDEARPASKDAPPESPPPPPSSAAKGQGAALGPAAAVVLLALAAPPPQDARPAGGAEEKDEVEGGIRVNIDTPVLKAIRESLRKRFAKLEPLYGKGAIGEKRDGYLEAREEGKLSLAEKRDLKALLAEENRDRKNLYVEIVKANRFSEERLKDVQAIFARKWIEKCRTGWWVQNPKGDWERKPPPKEAEGKKQAKTATPGHGGG